jgi:hypothetical protein
MLINPLGADSFKASIKRTQVAIDHFDGWRKVMYEGRSQRSLKEHFEMNVLDQATNFFNTFFHKDYGLDKTKNFIVSGNTIYEVHLHDSLDPGAGNAITEHHRTEQTYEYITRKVLERAFTQIGWGPLKAELSELHQDSQYLNERLKEWTEKAIPAWGNDAPVTAADIVFSKRYHTILDNLKAYIKSNLPTRKHVPCCMTFEDGEIYEPIPRERHTMIVWCCADCFSSSPMRTTTKTHIKTCRKRLRKEAPEKIIGVRVRMIFDQEDLVEFQPNPASEHYFNDDLFMQKHMCVEDMQMAREDFVVGMQDAMYERVFACGSIEDVIVSAFTHLFGRKALRPEFVCMFKTRTSLYIYQIPPTKASVGYRKERLMSYHIHDAGRIELLRRLPCVFEKIKLRAITPFLELREGYVWTKKDKISTRNYNLLEKAIVPGMDPVTWKTFRINDNFQFKHHPELRKFVDRLLDEVPTASEVFSM